MVVTAKMKVRLDFKEDVLGSLPADQELLTRFVSSKVDDPLLKAEEGDCVPERTNDSGHTVFPQDETGTFLYNYHIKGFLKEAGNNLKDAVGVKNLRSKIDNFLFIHPRRIYIHREGEGIVIEADDILERPLRAQTMRGPRVSLVGSERIYAPAYLELEIELLPHKELTLDVVRQLFAYGRLKGLGQWRNGGYGSFTWEEIDAVDFGKGSDNGRKKKGRPKKEETVV